jgi:hypothetical protein
MTMADRNSAAIFGSFFTRLASDPTEQHMDWAKEMWNETLGYDFSPYQMYCEEALIVLGLCRMKIDPEYPDEGEVAWYGEEGKDER